MKNQTKVFSHSATARALRVALMASSAITLLSAGAVAQDEADPAAEEGADGRVLDTIYVTSQKREQVAQDIPLSVKAISGGELEDAGVTAVSTLGQLAAGVTVASGNPGSLNISLRGIGNLSGNFAAGPSTGYYLDEAPISAFSTGVPEVAFWDAERVEVLRGPQGTLFGESAMGGTIRVISNKPDSTDFSGRAQVTASTIEDGESGFGVRGIVNIPLVEDQLALRVSGGFQEFVGWTDIPDLGLEDANDGEQADVRAQLRWTPNNKFILDLSYQHQTLDSEEFGASSPGRYLPSEVNPALAPVQALSPRENEYSLINATGSYDFEVATLVASLSRFDQEQSSAADRSAFAPAFFGIPGTITAVVNEQSIESTVAEVRLVSNGDNRLNWTLGAYAKSENRFLNGGFNITLPLLMLENDQSFNGVDSDTDATAAFADVEYAITDQISIDAGVRFYSSEIESVTTDLTSSAIFGGVAGTERPASGDADEVTKKLGISYRPTDNLLIYAKVSEGFREGGVNYVPPTEQSIPESFNPEKVTAYELGFKSQPTPWMTINGSVYQNDWEDLQLAFITPSGLFGFQDNAGEAKSTGGELEIVAQPTANLLITSGLSYIDATIEEDVLNAFGLPVASSGNTIPFTPEWQGSLAATYKFPLTPTLESVNSIALSYRGETFSEPENRDAEKNDAFTNLNLRAGVQADGWGAALFVNNALNEEATSARFRYVTALPVVFGNYVQPRTIGVELNKRF